MRRNRLALLALASAMLCSCTRTAPARTEQVLGTVCRVDAFGDGTAALYDELFARLHELDGLFNAHDGDSVISRVNAAAGSTAVDVPEEFALVLGEALRYAELTGGAFDPTIGPLVRLWAISTESPRVPTEAEIQEARALIGWSAVSVEDTPEGARVYLPRAGMGLDLGGIAKGYAADCLVRLLSEKHVRRAVIDLGGNACVFGKKPDGSAWRVGIKNPFQPEGSPPALVVSLAEGASVVTSGTYERFFVQDGTRYHHIIDPATGRPAERGYESVTIVARSSLQADALSTAAFLCGPDVLADPALAGNAAAFIMQDGSVLASGALRGSLSANLPGFAVTFLDDPPGEGAGND